MINTYLEFATGNPLTDAYLRGDGHVQSLYHYRAGDPAAITARAADVDGYYRPEQRRALVAALRAYAKRVTGGGDATEALLAKLSDDRALVVVTGQQAGIFSGPLYTIYKAVSAVAYAAYCEKTIHRPVVPVFWAAGEDHDFQEVADAWYVKDDGELSRAHLREQPYVRTPVGLHRIAADEMNRILGELAVHLPTGMYRDQTVAQIAAAYEGADNMVDGFVRLMSAWLKDFPMLYVNPLDKPVRELMSAAFRSVLARPAAYQAAAASGERAVREKGFEPQVELTPAHTLIYLIEHGKRTALDYNQEQGVFTLRDAKRHVSQQELLHRLEERPQDYSSGVLFRPVAQDYLLPVLAYVGGAAEIAYHGMMKEIFTVAGRKTPPLYLRERAYLLTRQVGRALERFQIKATDVLQGDFVFAKLLERETRDIDEWMTRLKSSLLTELFAAQSPLLEIDDQLERAVAKTERTIERGVDRLANRVRRTVLKNNQEVYVSARLLENWLSPKGKEQERVLSPLSAIAKFGTNWIRDLWFDTPPDWRSVQCIHLE